MRIFFELVIYFLIFSFCGWVSETSICSFNEKAFVKRGFLVGPFIPVYGFGGLIIVVFLAPFKNSPLLLYFAAVAMVTVLEYLTALLMETLFAIKLWDYSKYKFNLHGRVWLVSSLFFGILGLLGVYIINPAIAPFIKGLSTPAIYFIGGLASAYFITDSIASTKLTLKISSLMAKFNETAHALYAEFEAELPTKEELVAELHKRYDYYIDNLNTRLGRLQTRILKAYPNLSSKKHAGAGHSLKHYIEAKMQRKKNSYAESFTQAQQTNN